MEKKNENKLLMIEAVLRYLHQNEPEWNGFAPMSTAISELTGKVNQIGQLHQSTEINNSGLVTGKDNRNENLIIKVFELASMLFLMAKHTNNEVIKAKVNLTMSDLKNLRDRELPVMAQTILTIGQENAANLVTYGISAQFLTELQEMLEECLEELPAYRAGVSERKAANNELRTLISNAMLLLKEDMDKLMVKYRNSKPQFYAGYLNARKVVDYGTRYEKSVEPEAQA